MKNIKKVIGLCFILNLLVLSSASTPNPTCNFPVVKQ